jgi:hypothetical protein
MSVEFNNIVVGCDYSRQTLADLWGYAGRQALQRGVVTPSNTNKIILFVTEKKSQSATPYQDHLYGNFMEWEGPNDHFAEQRMVDADKNGDEIHLFYREVSRDLFTYYGLIKVSEFHRYTNRPSKFLFRLS